MSRTPRLKPRVSTSEHIASLYIASLMSHVHLPKVTTWESPGYIISDDSTSLMASNASLFLHVPSVLDLFHHPPESQKISPWCLFWLKPFFDSSCIAKSKPLSSLASLPALILNACPVLCPSSTLNCV